MKKEGTLVTRHDEAPGEPGERPVAFELRGSAKRSGTARALRWVSGWRPTDGTAELRNCGSQSAAVEPFCDVSLDPVGSAVGSGVARGLTDSARRPFSRGVGPNWIVSTTPPSPKKTESIQT